MKPGARRHDDLPTPPPSALFTAAVAWAREFYGLDGAATSEWDRWRGAPMESVMRICWHGARGAGELFPTKKGLAGLFGLTSSCTAARNASLPLMGHEREALTEILDKLGNRRTWIGVRCPGCGEVTPVLDAGRELDETSAATPHERNECRRIAEEGIRCPACKRDLRNGVLGPSTAPQVVGA